MHATSGIGGTPDATPAELVPARGHPMRKLLSAAAVAGVILLVLAVGGAIFQGIATARDRDRFAAAGEMVDVGGHELHILCSGVGTPTVILDHAGGSNSAQWALVQPEVAALTRVCAYDRAGFGWSQPGVEPLDAGRAADELEVLLANAGINGPYVLVGHSYGAFVARLFADRHPDTVAGIVLVDPGPPYEHPLTPPGINEAWKTEEDMMFAFAPYAARIGLMRLAGPGTTELPADAADAYAAMNQTTTFWDSVSAVDSAMRETSAQIVALGAPALPTIVLSAGQPDDEPRRVWTALNATLAGQPGGEHRVMSQLGHMDFALTRVGATITTEAVLDMVTDARDAGLDSSSA